MTHAYALPRNSPSMAAGSRQTALAAWKFVGEDLLDDASERGRPAACLVRIDHDLGQGDPELGNFRKRHLEHVGDVHGNADPVLGGHSLGNRPDHPLARALAVRILILTGGREPAGA